MYVFYDFFFRSTRLATFPDYLMVQLKKFTIGEDWIPRKLGNATKIINLFLKGFFSVARIGLEFFQYMYCLLQET